MVQVPRLAGVDGVEQPFGLRRLLHFLDDHAGLDHELVVEFIDGDDAVEPFCAQADAAL